MVESATDNLAIVLNVIEGTRFDTRKHAVVIKANLGGNILESDAIVPGDVTVTFKNNLIWSTNRDAIKRMKEENQPIKLECYMQTTESNRQLIGFVLLPMRSIPFWNSRKIGMMKPHWYKLHGLSQENKAKKPELLVSVSIGNKEEILNEDEKRLIPVEADIKSNEHALNNNLKSQPDLLVDKVGNNEIHIVGIEQTTEQNDFIVVIILKKIEFTSQCPEDDFQLSYTLFDKQILNAKRNSEQNGLLIDEKISITFKSSLSNLVAYFKRIFNLPVELFSTNGDNKLLLGTVHLNFSDSLSTLPASIENFKHIFAADNYAYAFDNFCNIDTSLNKTTSIQGAVHYSFSLKLIPLVCSPTPSNLMLPLTTLQTINFTKITSQASSKHLSPLPLMKEREDIDLNHHRDKNFDVPISFPKTFSYTLALLDCSFNKRPFPGIWRLTLQHPLADITSAVRNLEISNVVVDQISFEDMTMRLYFTTYFEQLHDLIKSKPCVLTLKGPRGVQATAELDNNNILSQRKSKGIVLLENDLNEQIAMAHISVEIEEIGLNFNTESTFRTRRQQGQQIANTFLDEDFAYKMIEELEEWKQAQQSEFLADLKRHEIAHLTLLSNEWQRKRTEEEIKLQKKMDQCGQLTQTLEEAHLMFKERNRTDTEYEQTLLKTRAELEKCYARKIDTLNGKILQMEREQEFKEKTETKSMKRMESVRDRLKVENDILKAKIQSLQKELMVANTINEDYVEHMQDLKECVKILNNELEKVKKSKMIYKDRWAQIVREIQKIKRKNSEFDLDEDYLGLSELLKSARSEYSNDH